MKIIEPTIQVNKDQVQMFLKTRTNLRDRTKDATGTLGGETNTFIERHGLNKTGLATFNRFNEMSPEKRADALRTFDGLRAYFEDEWNNQEELFEGVEAA